MSDWLGRSQDCPSCRSDVATVSKSFQARNTVQMVLQAEPERKRTDSVLRQLEGKNIFRTDIHRIADKVQVKKPVVP